MYDYSKIPQEMKDQPRWVLWKRVERDGKVTKIPINVLTGMGAKSNDPSTWTDFETALGSVGAFGCDGLGFMLGNGFFGVDLDHALDNQEGKALCREFADALHSYTEISQSGTGIHIICKGALPVGGRKRGNVEMYDANRFFALTGRVVKGYESLAERTNEIKPLWERYLNPKDKYVFHRAENAPAGVQLGDNEVVSRALASKSGALFSSLYYGQWEGLGYPSQSNADMAFCSLLAFWCGKDPAQMDRIFRSSKLMRPKWDEKRGDTTYGAMTIERAIATTQDAYAGSREDGGAGGAEEKHYDLNDTGNALRFRDEYGGVIRYNYDMKAWLIWDGKTWTPDTTQKVKNLADRMIEKMKREAYGHGDDDIAPAMWKNVKHLSSSSGKEAMLKEAQHLKGIATSSADYDTDKYLLNCENGVVDLRTGEIKPFDKALMLNKNTHISVDRSGQPELWLKTLDGIFKGNQQVINFVQKAIGYTLTGEVKEQCFFQCYGAGSNGKSVFLNTIYKMLGDYSLNSQVESILTRGNGSSGNASPDIARMNGARFVRTNEPNDGARFNEGLVKQLTGGDVVTARYLYGQDFEFNPVFKLWIATNYKINVRGTDKGIWRRMRLIPFEATFEGKDMDKDLETKLEAELPKILGWAVEGCLRWQKEGLGLPDEIESATHEYQTEMDLVQQFSNACLLVTPQGREKASAVFRAYRRWARESNEWDGMTQSKFGIEMSKKYEKKNINGYVFYLGIKLKEPEGQYTYVKGISEDDE